MITTFTSTITPKKTKSAIRLNTSPHGRSTSKKNHQSTPNKKQQINSSIVVKEIKKMREKLCSVLNTYILIYENNSPLRCLQHNSVLSLYCATEKKLLCANCVFRNDTHKQHKILPIDKCYVQIMNDIEERAKQIEKQAGQVNSCLNAINSYIKNQQKYANDAIVSLTQLYQQVQHQLLTNFREAKTKIILAMQQSLIKKQPLLNQLQYFKNMLQRHHITKFQKMQEIKKQNITLMQKQLIFQHLIQWSLLEYSHVDQNKVIEVSSRVKTIEKRQMEKIKEFKNVMEKWSCSKCAQQYQK